MTVGTTLKVGPVGAEWLQIDVPRVGLGQLFMRRLDDRFDDLATRQADYDFNTAGEYEGASLAALLDAVTELAASDPMQDHLVLKASSGQSVIVAGDEAAELLPRLRWAVALATRN